jgi:hypothetical protein
LVLARDERQLLELVDQLSFLLTAVLRPPGTDEEIVVSPDGAITELKRLRILLEDPRLFYRYVYYTDSAYFGDSGPHTGVVGGFRMSGEQSCAFNIDSGVGYCKLIRIVVDPKTGRGQSTAEIDIRDRSTVETLETGVIRIERRPAATGFQNKIRILGSWIEKCQGSIHCRVIKKV